MLSMQEISDRLEIQDLLFRYSHHLDRQDWDALKAVFTPDAEIDYSEMGGSKGDLDETVTFLKMAMPNFASYQHMVSNIVIDFDADGNTAHTRTICHNPMVMDKGGGDTHVFFCGLWYRDVLVRTPDGWRIKERVEEKSFFHNVPAEFSVPTD
jgi:3-phenylpropionate/cinnamic acid dioxygenase small subunit